MFTRLVLAVLALHLALTAPTHAGDNSERERVVIAQFGKEKFLLYLPLYVAMEEGLFAKQGLDVDLRFAGNDDQIFATVMSGSAQFGVGDPVFAAISREKGGPGKIVAMMVTRLGLSGYTNKPTIPDIASAADATGLRIGSIPAPSTTYTLLREFIRNNKLDHTTLVQVAIGAQLAALEAGQLDVAVDLEPSVSVAESKGYRVNFLFDRFTETQAITGISTLPTFS
jgi:NitT/TauT family transport system substrate-binding protein